MQALRGATLALGLQVNRLRIQRCAPAQAKNGEKPRRREEPVRQPIGSGTLQEYTDRPSSRR